MSQRFDLVIIGAGCVGMAAAYYALKMNKTVCIIEKNMIGDVRKFWSQDFIARQNRLLTNEEYLTRFISASNEQWEKVQQELGKEKLFIHKQGTLWFGDKNVNTSEGNIKTAHETIMQINRSLKQTERKIESLYIDQVIAQSPKYMRAFKPETQFQWDSWSSLYQPQGASIDMKGSYDAFYNYVKSCPDKAIIYDKTVVVKHECSQKQFKHTFISSSNKVIEGRSVFICTGIYTPHFLKDVMNYPHLVENNYRDGECNRQYRIEEYVSSYMKVEQGYENYFSHIPSFINFIKQNSQESDYTTFGFPFHEWDTVGKEYFIKIGTTAHKKFDSLEDEMKFIKYTAPPQPQMFKQAQHDDQRVIAALNFVKKRMNGISSNSPLNKHYPYPMIFYEGKYTILDYLHRNDSSVVVQSGGWLVNEYPLMAKTVVQMLFQANKIQKDREEENVIGNFLNMTRFPIKSYVNDKINKLNYNYPKKGELKTAIIGAGCAGLYSAYRLNEANKDSIGIFDISQRISGGLRSFEIHSTTTPIEIEQLKYNPMKHNLVNKVVKELGISNISLPVEEQSVKTTMKRYGMKTNCFKMIDWRRKQLQDPNSANNFKLKGHLLGMTAYQIISFSLYQILTAPENIVLLTELFLEKTKVEIALQKERAKRLKQTIQAEQIYYRNWQNYVKKDEENPLSYQINLTLMQWNKLRQVLLFRFPYEVTEKDIYEMQGKVEMSELYPLYKFGFQNVIQSQFGHQAYKFIAEQNGYFSNTSNSSYIDQVMTYLLECEDACQRTLSGGFDNINYAMAIELLDEQKGLHAKNGGIYLNHKLVNIQKVSNRYLLTFHCKNENSPVKMEDQFKSSLLSGVKRSKLNNLVHKELGVAVPLPQKPGFSSIQFMAEKVILGLPKRSILALYNEIDLFQQPISSYEELHKSDRRQYQSIFKLSKLTQQVIKNTTPLSYEQKQQRQKLLKKQHLFYRDPTSNSELSPGQSKKLIELSERCFYSMVSKLNIDPKKEHEKIKRFSQEEPCVPKNLQALTETTQAVPAFKIMMNFNKNWWDPIQRTTSSCRQPINSTCQSMRLNAIKGMSFNELSVRHTMQVSLGQDNLLMCTYNDRISTEFWMTLHKNFEKVWAPKMQTMKQMKSGSSKPIISCPNNQTFYPAKEVIVREMLKELSLIHKTQVKEQWLKQCVCQFLGNDRYGAGYHHFNSGYYIPSIMQCMRKPWKNQSIHFVGEVFSNISGSVEGAFQTAEHLMQKEFGMKPLVQNYYAGY